MTALPDPHAAFLNVALARCAADPRLVGVAAGGSYATGTIDEFSDLDLVIAVEPDVYEAVLRERSAIAAGLGPLLAAFTGEHVHEPRLLICLYGPPLLHVDLKFVRLEDVAVRVEDPVVLWERDGRLRAALVGGVARFPEPDPQWIEDRMWSWVHYAATKIGRGELFQAVDFLADIRALAIGPLILKASGARPSGVRKIELAAPDWSGALTATIGAYDSRACLAALRAAVCVYRSLRDPQVIPNTAAEAAVMEYVEAVAARLDGTASLFPAGDVG